MSTSSSSARNNQLELQSLSLPFNDVHNDSGDEADAVPLFNPSGLSSSANPFADGSGFDLSSHAATRLGLSPPPISLNTNSGMNRQDASDSLVSTSAELPGKRGRRRRSSEFLATAQPGLPCESLYTPTPDHIDGLPCSSDSPPPWWERRSNSLSLNLPVTRVKPLSSFSSSHDDSRSPSSATTRSQAADYLSSFTDENAISAQHTRDSSNDQPTSLGRRTQSVHDSNSQSRTPSLHSIQTDMSSSWQGFGGAAGILAAQQGSFTPSSSTTMDATRLRPDEEGYRFGPGGRYVIGKLIGFGGFSTIREGWEIGLDRNMESGNKSDREDKHKVAVKITYHDSKETTGDELVIWRHLPAHPNLLPLLHDERVLVDKPAPSLLSSKGSTSVPRATPPLEKQEIELLVMPYCEGGNLMSYIRTEGGRKRLTSPTPSLSRHASLRRSMEPGSMPRSGTNFASLSSARADRIVSTGSSFSTPRSSSGVQRTFSQSSTSLQRTPSSAARSRGVSMQAARETTRQLAEGIMCLHKKARIIHGDIKLENILGQPKRAGLASRTASIGSSMHQPTSATTTDEDIHWRLADFGLSQTVSVEDRDQDSFSHDKRNLWLKQDIEGDRNRRDSRRSRHPPAGLIGGSIAYTPPERWQDKAGESSPVSTPHSRNAVYSPYAADMWALGCIVYALLSGKLPFNDAFEPRLQAKIAKGDWDLPPRLWRRARRLFADSSHSTDDFSQHSRSASHQSGDKTSSSQPKNYLHKAGSKDLELTADDLSISLPTLPPHRSQDYQPLHHGTASAHDAPVVGSVPTKLGEFSRFDIDVVAQAAADAEADPESDEDGEVDQSWDGTSAERASAREVLNGLLNVDPSQRWTVEQLVRCRWLYDGKGLESYNPFDQQEQSRHVEPSERPRRQLHDLHEEASWGESEPPKPPQWNRQKSWRSELAFDKVDQAAVQRRQQRDSSLTRSRPASRQTTEDRNSSASRSASLHRQRDEQEATNDVTSNIVRSKAGSPSPVPPSPNEVRGRRPRMTRFEGNNEHIGGSSAAFSRSRPIDITSSSNLNSRSQSLSRVTSQLTTTLSRGVDRGGEVNGDVFGLMGRRSHSRPPLLSHSSTDASSPIRGGGSDRRSTSGSRGGRFSTSERSSPALMEPTKATSTRSSTSRSRSRAPDALAQALKRGFGAGNASANGHGVGRGRREASTETSNCTSRSDSLGRDFTWDEDDQTEGERGRGRRGRRG